MKDDEKVELRVGDIRRAAEKCGTAKEVLKEMFPEVFKESPPNVEWEDITMNIEFISYNETEVVTMFRRFMSECPFKLVFNDDSPLLGMYREKYKLENGKIWRRKS